jgi:hypothetical protein
MITEVRDRINIKELTAIEPMHRKGFASFNPENDIKSFDWDYLINSVKGKSSFPDLDFFNMAYHVSVLSPKRLQWIPTGKKQESVLQEYMRNASSSVIFGYEYPLMHKMLFPQKRSPEISTMVNWKWDAFRDYVGRKIPEAKQDSSSFKSDAVLSLATISHLYTLSDPAHKKFIEKETLVDLIKTQIHQFRTNDYRILTRANLNNFTQFAACLKILSPNMYEKVAINNEELGWMKDELESKAGDWTEFAEFAYYMSLISAKEIKVTDKGVALKYVNDATYLAQKDKFIPEMRKF